jgi:hypothetical protein
MKIRNIDMAQEHPYDPHAYLNVFQEGCEKRRRKKAGN